MTDVGSEAPWRDKETLERLHWDEGLNQGEIADQLGCTRRTVATWFSKHDIKARKGRPRKDDESEVWGLDPKTEPWKDKDVLEELYHDVGLTIEQMAERLGCNHQTAMNWVNWLGIEKINRGERISRAYRRRPVSYSTDLSGYERWKHGFDGESWTVAVHRLLAVAEYGFDALDGMHVHHKNGIPWDNRPDNIDVLSPPEHMAVHHYGELVGI